MLKNKVNLRNVVAGAICLAVSMTLFSCLMEKQSTEKQILSFGFTYPNVAGVINEGAKTIAVIVPEGTNVTALVPLIIVSDKATVRPGSGVVNSFTHPVAYTVTAEDGSTAVYTVTVIVDENGEPGKVAKPVANPAAGAVDFGTEIVLSCSTSGAKIRYTTDGSNPTSSNGTLYSAENRPEITEETTLKAIAYKEGMTNSNILVAEYTINGSDPEKVAKPVANPAAGAVASGTEIVLSCSTSGATIRYTTDGTNPTVAIGTVYSAEDRPVITEPTTLKAIAYKAGMTNSNILIAEYTISGSGGQPIELTSPIKANMVLTDLGLPVDYIYNGGWLLVENNATLTIEPGVTIKFTNSSRSGGIEIKSGSVIQAIGTASKHIRFIGMNEEKGSWRGIYLHDAMTDNQFVYCDFVNAGYRTGDEAALYLSNAKVGVSHCTFTRGFSHGLKVWSASGNTCEFSFFDNNIIKDYDQEPVYLVANPGLKLLEKFDMTSDFTQNEKAYIHVENRDMSSNVTINQTTVPYCFNGGVDVKNVLTINEGVTIYMKEGTWIKGAGRLMINGTPSNMVKFTRMNDTYYYWGGIEFSLLGSVIKNCIFEYGGKNYGTLYLYGNCNLTLENVAINNSITYGAELSSSYGGCNHTINHSGVTFSNCKLGNVKDPCRGGGPIFDGLP